MLFCQRGFVILVASEIFLNWIGERVFLRHVLFQNGIKLRPFRRELREFKVAAFLEADKKDALAVLRHDALGRLNGKDLPRRPSPFLRTSSPIRTGEEIISPS